MRNKKSRNLRQLCALRPLALPVLPVPGFDPQVPALVLLQEPDGDPGEGLLHLRQDVIVRLATAGRAQEVGVVLGVLRDIIRIDQRFRIRSLYTVFLNSFDCFQNRPVSFIGTLCKRHCFIECREK